MSFKQQRIRGRHAVLVFVLLSAAGATGAWFALGQRPQPDRIVALVAVGPDHAIMVRTVRDQPDRSFLSLYERERGERWGALIPRYEVPPRGRVAVAATAEVVAVRTIASHEPTIMAFGGERGHKLGRLELVPGLSPADVEAGLSLAGAGTLVGHGESFELYGKDGAWAAVFAVDLMRGAQRWRADLGAAPVHRAWLRPAHVVIHAGPAIVLLDRETGDAVAQVPARTTPCVTEEAIYTLEGGVLRAVSLRDLDERSAAVTDAGAALDGMCAQHGDHVLLALALAEGGGALLAVDRHTLQPAWTLELPARIHRDDVALQVPDRAPLSGEVPRFVPVLLDAPAGAGPARDARPALLAMIDASSGRVAWTSAARAALAGAHLIRTGRIFHLYEPGTERLVVLDGDTGAVAAARELPGYEAVWPAHIEAGRVWVFGGERWGVLDGVTLEPLPGAGGAQVGADVRDELRRELGL